MLHIFEVEIAVCVEGLRSRVQTVVCPSWMKLSLVGNGLVKAIMVDTNAPSAEIHKDS
jgi:hypothetical protein